MDIVSGFNHQKPGDNNKPMIYHEGKDTYVLNKTARTDGQPLYYGVGKFGRYIELSNGEIVDVSVPVITIRGLYDPSTQAIAALYINTDSDYDVNLKYDKFSVVYNAAPLYTCPLCILNKVLDTYALVAFDASGDHIFNVTFKCADVVPSAGRIKAEVISDHHHDISSLAL